jgi:hypothetical protein
MLQTALLFCFGIFLSQTRQMFRNSSASTFRKDSFDGTLILFQLSLFWEMSSYQK